MIKIGDRVRIDRKLGQGHGRTHECYKATVVSCSNFFIVVNKDNGIRESFNLGRLLDENTSVAVKHGKKQYDPVDKAEIRKMFGVR